MYTTVYDMGCHAGAVRCIMIPPALPAGGWHILSFAVLPFAMLLSTSYPVMFHAGGSVGLVVFIGLLDASDDRRPDGRDGAGDGGFDDEDDGHGRVSFQKKGPFVSGGKGKGQTMATIQLMMCPLIFSIMV